MASVAATPKRRRGGRRIVVALVILVLIVVGIVVWLNVAAQAQVNASGTLTVYQAAASVSHNGTDFASALTGSVVQPGDSVKTDTKGRAAITLPDGTLTRLASDTTIKVDAANFTKSGNLHDGTPTQQIARTSTNVQNAVAVGTTPGTEQDFVGAPLHNSEQQTYSYSYAGGSAVKASLGYPGSAMKLTVKAPDGQSYVATGKLPTVTVKNGPAGIYTIIVGGVSGLGTQGEEPFVAVASAESCVSADIAQNHAVHRGYTAHDLILALNQSGGVP